MSGHLSHRLNIVESEAPVSVVSSSCAQAGQSALQSVGCSVACAGLLWQVCVVLLFLLDLVDKSLLYKTSNS